MRYRVVWGVAGLVGLLIAAYPVSAQFGFAWIPSPADNEPLDPAKQPFAIPTQSTESAEALADFRRYSRRGVWEKAFKSLEHAALKGQGLVARPDGVMLPAGQLVQQSLAELSPAGREAYRVFYDAEARKLLAQAQGKDEAATLLKIVDNFLITTVGDTSADRLGDLYFEQGNMDGAARAWQAVLSYRADSGLDRALLLVKLGTALAHSGRWEDFHKVERELVAHHSGAQVTLGGRAVSAEQQLSRLAAEEKTVRDVSIASTGPEVRLPVSEVPLWQWRPFGKPDENSTNAVLQFRDPWGRNSAVDLVLPMASDGRRVYSNLLGYEVAVDLESGKLLWRTGKYVELLAKSQQQQIIYPEMFSITVAGDRLWSVGAPFGNQRGQGYLKCLEAATGKELLHSKNITSLQSWSFSGSIIAEGDRIYAGAFKSNTNTDLHVLAMAASDGKILWDCSIGSHRSDQHQQYMYRKTAQPTLLLHSGKLFVDTHAGALAEVDASNGTLEWATLYPSEAIRTGYDYYEMPLETFTVGAPYLADGMLFFKGMRSDRLMAMRPQGPALAWTRSVSQKGVVVGADESRVYLGGEEMTAYDLRTRSLLWSCPLPLGSGTIRPVLTRNHLLQFTPRGIYVVDKVTGNLVRLFRGGDMGSNGGIILLTPKSLITSSNQAITAYRIDG